VPPGAMGRFLLTQMASVAELEAGLISERTKAVAVAAGSIQPKCTCVRNGLMHWRR
jgi:DNA invertase Pin-like site-specific DNA recombinase